MADTVWVRCESGLVIEHASPLPEGLAQRVASGEAAIVNEDGTPIVETPEVPAEGAVSKPMRFPKQAQDAGGQSPDDEPPTDAPAKKAPVKAATKE